MTIKKNRIDSGVNRANTIYIWLAMSGSGHREQYMISGRLALVTKVGDLDFPLIQNVQCYKVYNSIIMLYY